MPPLVTIVTPVKNGARFLPALLESVREQDHPDIEHIVVDGGSTDGTLDILHAAPNVRVLTGADRGMYDAINRGLTEARGEVLGYQNSDDRYADPGAISALVAHLTAQPQTDVVYGSFRFMDAEGRPGAEVSVPEFDARALYRHNFVPPHATLVRRSVVHGSGIWLDPSLRFTGDWDWFVRMAKSGKRFARIPRVVAEFRRHAQQTTATMGFRPKLSEWRRTCRKNGTSLGALLFHEMLYIPLRRQLGVPPS